MSGNPKFGVLERGGEEYTIPVEYTPESSDILYKEGEVSTVRDRLDNPQFPRVFIEAFRVESGNIAILHEPDFEGNLILEGDLVII